MRPWILTRFLIIGIFFSSVQTVAAIAQSCGDNISISDLLNVASAGEYCYDGSINIIGIGRAEIDKEFFKQSPIDSKHFAFEEASLIARQNLANWIAGGNSATSSSNEVIHSSHNGKLSTAHRIETTNYTASSFPPNTVIFRLLDTNTDIIVGARLVKSTSQK